MPHALTIVIPTYGRNGVLLATLNHLFALDPPASEIIVIDQTVEHTSDVSSTLKKWHDLGRIRWLRLKNPSIPKAMNRGLIEANHPIVLFLDDDIIPNSRLVAAHADALTESGAALVAGRIIQPWQGDDQDCSGRDGFHFASLDPAWISDFMGGNFSLHRETALRLGGFDEQFVQVAYNFEAEFAYRLRCGGYQIYYEPAALVHHLRVRGGGTRAFGDHLRSYKPNHAVGAYYFILRTWSGWQSLVHFLRRPLRAISTRHHLRRPWWIPATAIAELSGMAWALVLAAQGPRYLISGNCSRLGELDG